MALFNSGYPATYQNPYLIQQPQYAQPQQSGIIWIQGESAAKSYLVAPNTSVALWDSERQTVYIKSADASGMPSMKTLDYTIRENAQPQPANTVIYATKDDVASLNDQIAAVRAEIEKVRRIDNAKPALSDDRAE